MTLRRRTVLGAGTTGLIGALALGGCTPGPGTGADLGARPEPIPVDSVSGLEPVPADDAHLLETSDQLVQVTRRRITPDLTPREARRILGLAEDPEHGITAPEGTTFLVVDLTTAYHAWPLTGPEVRTLYQFRIRRPDGAADMLQPLSHAPAGTYLLRVPAEPRADDAVLEATTHGRVQQLSLVDGTHLPLDLEHLSTRMTEVAWPDGTGADLTWWEDPATGQGDALSLDLGAMVLTPVNGRIGWPEGRTQLLGVRASPYQRFSRSDGSGVVLPVGLSGHVLLPDGTRARALTTQREGLRLSGGQFELADCIVWFAVPLDLASATLHLDILPTPRRSDLPEKLGIADELDVPLTFSRAQRRAG